MKATFKNTPDEFSCEPTIPSTSIDRIEVEMIGEDWRWKFSF